MTTVYYVYVLFDELGVPRYVGKGKNNRWIQHERRSSDNWMKDEFIERTFALLGEVPKLKVREKLTEAEAFETEIALIKAIGRFPRGPLLNMTDGGDGTSGAKRSMLTKRRMSEARIGVPLSASHRASLSTGQRSRWATASPDDKAKLLANLAIGHGHRWTDEQRRRLSITKTGSTHTPESRAKMSAARKGIPLSPETRQKMSAARRGRGPRPPEVVARISATHRASHGTEARVVELRHMIDEGLPTDEMAQRLQLAVSALYCFASRHGVRLRGRTVHAGQLLENPASKAVRL